MKARGAAYLIENRRRQALPVTDGKLRIAVVADTHSAPHRRALELVAREEPTFILHAGDIGALSVVERLRAIAPTIAIRGNIDPKLPELPDAITLDLEDGNAVLLTMLLVHIAVNGPRLRADAVRLAKSEGAQMVVCGHSHVPFIGRDRHLSIFNPGSIGPRRFHLPIVFGMLELANGRMAMKHVDCETGETWCP